MSPRIHQRTIKPIKHGIKLFELGK